MKADIAQTELYPIYFGASSISKRLASILPRTFEKIIAARKKKPAGPTVKIDKGTIRVDVPKAPIIPAPIAAKKFPVVPVVLAGAGAVALFMFSKKGKKAK